MSELTCLRCKTPLDPQVEACPQCSEKVTQFQRTYATRLIDGKYQILERLGLGGMGEIFKVLHIHLGEQRVIKIMRANIASDDQSLQRFLQEARMATMIKHRNLAMLYDFSTLDDGSYYMVWEYIEGTNIQKWIAANGPMPPRLAVEIAIQALRGLEALHEMGIIHRDISPENIMMSQDHLGKLLCKVIDFGIAKQLGEGEGGTGHGLTQTGMFLGKLKYASPEQAGFIKEGETLDHRSDLYSFGVVFYEMLAGRAPFLATNPHGYILKHATEKPLPISQTNPAVTIPPKLEEIVFKTLEKDRDDRFLTTEEFIRALEAIRNDITPDAKYGVGERMMTMTARTTHVDLAARTRTGATSAAPTATRPAATPPRPAPTQDGATVVEKTFGSAPATMGDGATVVERAAGSQATIVERVGGAGSQATVVEPKVTAWQQPRDGDATVLERQVLTPPTAKPKSKAMLFGGIAAAVVIAAVMGGYVMLRPGTPPVDVTTPTTTGVATTATAGTAVGEAITTTTTPAGAGGSGGLGLITASPSASIDSIFNVDTNQPVTLSTDDRSLPFYQALEAGNYKVTVRDARGSEQTLEIRVDSGAITQKKVNFGSPSVEDAMKELFGQ